jgi:hypothetical protein
MKSMGWKDPELADQSGAALCYNTEFMVQFFIAVLRALRVSSVREAIPPWRSSLASKSPCSNANDRGRP